MPNRKTVYATIDQERTYQNQRWPGHSHEVAAYILYIEEYVAKARATITASNDADDALQIVRKIAALAVACMEEHGAPNR